MKRFLLILFTIHYSLFTCPQEITEQQLENLTDAEQLETEDDSYLLQLEQFRKNPVNLNRADVLELKELRIISDLQIASLISYRRLFGNLINIYELQAVPLWDVVTIRKLLPFITVDLSVPVKEDFKHRIKEGDHSLLLRISQVLEKSKGFDRSVPGTKYIGSRQRIFFRYRYAYKNLLQFGLAADKDAGEQFLKGAQGIGFDFYSVHLFARKIGNIHALALGDFTVNMGQGLIQWQSLAFKKSADVISIKRQSPVLRPYNSAGEFNFYRGAGITVKKKDIEATLFASLRKLSSNLVRDTIMQQGFVTSFLTSGYHRTTNEIIDRNNLRQVSTGINIKYIKGHWQIGVNGIGHKFSLPLNKTGEPYNLYSVSGSSWYNMSIDYNYTFRNFHFFGEVATDKNNKAAFVNGMLASVDPCVDISILHRSIDKEYQAVNANAFTENTVPSNETGLYAGITIRPVSGVRIDLYNDIYKFPWLKYQVDAPSYGKDFMAQLIYMPTKHTEMYMRYRNETREGNEPGNTTITNYLVQLPRKNWRIHVNHRINASVVLRNRVEIIWYDRKGSNSETGFLSFFDIMYKPLALPYSAVLRLQYFETGGYNSRLYAYENDVLYSYSVPVFFDKGFRYYLTLNYDLTKRIFFWLRWSQVIYSAKDVISSGLDEIQGNKKTEIKFQGLYIF